jgi:hypothetical protein
VYEFCSSCSIQFRRLMVTAHSLCSVYFHQSHDYSLLVPPRYHFLVLACGKKVNSWDDSCRVPDWCVSKSGDEGGSQDNSGVSQRNSLRINRIGVLDRRPRGMPSFLASYGACVAHDHRPGSKSGVIGSSGDRAGPGRGFSIHLCTLLSGRYRGSW